MTDTDKAEFHLHPETVVRDAFGGVVFTTASLVRDVPLPGWRGEAEQESDSRQHPVSSLKPVHGLCLVRDELSDKVLCQIFQTVHCGLPFCVTPKCLDSSSIDDAARVEETRADGVHSLGRNEATSGLALLHYLSSGSSGVACRIQRYQQSWIRSFDANAAMLQITANDSYATVGSVSHSLPLYASLEACHLGSDLHLLSDMRPARQLRALHTLGTTVLSKSNLVLRLEFDLFRGTDLLATLRILAPACRQIDISYVTQ